MERIVTFLLVIFSLFIFSCQHNQITNPPTQSDIGSSVSFYFAKPAGLDSLVVSAKALVSAPGMDSIWSDLAVNDTSVTGTIEDIPAGPHRKFEIFTYDADTNLTYYGHEFADVPSGGAVTVQILLYPVNTTGTVIVVGNFSNFPPPMGKIVFQADYNGSNNIYIVNPDGSHIVNLTNTPGVDNILPRFSPDGSKITFCRLINGIRRPLIMDSDGSNLNELNILPGYFVGRLAWSPNARQLTFSSPYDGDAEIYIYNFDDNQVVQITNNSSTDWFPDWSPNADWIVYQTDESGLFKINLMHPDGSAAHQVIATSGLEEKDPEFSPDGSRILFYGRDNSSAWDLFIVNIDGSNLVRLTNTSGINEQNGCWTGDGQAILFGRNDGGGNGYGIYRLQSDGTGLTRILDTSWNEDFPFTR